MLSPLMLHMLSRMGLSSPSSAMYGPTGEAEPASPWDLPPRRLGQTPVPDGYRSPDVEFAQPLPPMPTPSDRYGRELAKITSSAPGIAETIGQIENKLGPLPDSTRLYAAQDLRDGKPIGEVIAGIKNLKGAVLSGQPAPDSFTPGSPGPARPQGLFSAPGPQTDPPAHQPVVRHSTPEGDSYGAFMPKSYGGQPVDEQTAHAARGAGLLALGERLFAASSRGGQIGDILQGLASGAREGLSARDEVLGRNRDLQRQQHADERQAALDERQTRAFEEESKIRSETFAHNKGEWESEDQKKARTSVAAAQMVSVIEKAAGPTSPEAERARALAALGEDTDLSRLATLHDEIIDRQRLPEDARLKSRLQIEAEQAAIAAGVAADPRAAEARANRQLDMEGARLGLERQRQAAYERSLANRPAGGQGGAPTPEQLADDINSEADQLFKQWQASRGKVGEMDPTFKDDPVAWQKAHPPGPDGRSRLPVIAPATPVEEEAARADAHRRAVQAVQARIQAAQAARKEFFYDPATGRFGGANPFDDVTGGAASSAGYR